MEARERTSTRGAGSIRWTVGDLPAERLEAEIVTQVTRGGGGSSDPDRRLPDGRTVAREPFGASR